MSLLPANGPPPPSSAPAHFRKFKFRFNFDPCTGQPVSGGEGEVSALNYSSALVKIVALFADQPGRMLALQFEDITNQRVITPTRP